MLRYRSALLLPLVIAVLGLLPTRALAGAEFSICTAEKDQIRPDISGSAVVWEEAYSQTDHDIQGYDLAQSLPISIAAWTSNQQSPAISCGVVVWDDDRNSLSSGQDIYGYHLPAGPEFPICTAASNQYSPAIYGDVVVWEETRNYGTTGWDIYGYNISLALEFPICTAEYDQWSPCVGGDLVAWEDYRGTVSDIYGYHLSGGEESVICDYSDWQYDPAIAGHTVVWWDTRGGTTTANDVYGYNLLTGTEFPISTAANDQECPDIAGDIVVWQDRRNYATSGYDVYGYDLATGTEFAICTAPGDQYEPAISGSIVVWQDNRDSATTGWDIWGRGIIVADFSWAPAAPTDLDTVQFTDQSSDYEGSVVSYSWDFGDGGTSTDPDPTHQFAAGIWTVCLTATDSGTPPISRTRCRTIAVSGQSCIIICDGNACGGSGPRNYYYELIAPGGSAVDHFVMGALDCDLDHYTGWVLPEGWWVTGIFADPAPLTDGFTPHGELSSPAEQCPCWLEIQGPPIANGAVGFDHPGGPRDVGWVMQGTAEPPWGCAENWAAPVGSSGGPIHAPMPPPNQPPECCFEYGPPDPTDQTPVEFASCSYDPDGAIASWLWDFGDGGASTESVAVHLFEPGEWSVCLTVVDDGDPAESAMCCQTISVAGHPCQVTCRGAVCGGEGERSYWYELTAPTGEVFDHFLIGTHDCNPENYQDWVLPDGWWVTGIFADPAPLTDGFTQHGALSTPTEQCPCWLEIQGPPIANGAVGFNHPGEPRDVGWQLSRVGESPWACAESWAAPVGLGEGPVHAPMPPPNEPPICCFEYGPLWPHEGMPVEFFDCSWDPDGAVVAWLWDFGDGGTAGDQNPTHAFEAGGWEVSLTVTDDDGETSTCGQQIFVFPPTVEVSIPLVEGWHMISLPLEPVDKTILIDRASGLIDPGAIFYTSWVQGNDPRMRLFRLEPGAGYWVYNPELYPDYSWYEVGVEPPPGKPHPGPWWQGFWFLVQVPGGITLSYEALPLPVGPDVRSLDITGNYPPGTFAWAWMMIGACARMPTPYTPDVTAWPSTSTASDMTWGVSAPPSEPTTWLPTSDCVAPDAWHQGHIGLPMVGYVPSAGYYAVSPPQGEPLCGAPANTDILRPGEGYWLDVEDPECWLRLLAGEWP